jgi:NitT/TauT family transport system permease protein
MIRRKYNTMYFYFGVLIIWQLVYHLGVNVFEIWKGYSFPNPAAVLNSLFHLSKEGVLLQAILCSLRRATWGYIFALSIGVAIGILMEINAYLKRSILPILIGGQSIPSICWVPFAILWFGLQESAIIFVVFMGSVFSVILSINNAIEEVPNIYTKVAKTMGASRRNILVRVILPAACPSFVSGLKQSWSFAWRALMSGEVLYSCSGLGYTLIMGRELADINQVMAVMIVIIFVGMLIDKLIFSNILCILLKKRGLSETRK